MQTRPRPSFNSRPVQPNNQTYNYSQTNKIQNQIQYYTFTNLGRPLNQLYEQLKVAGKIGVVPPKIYLRGIPAGYDPQAICAYHSESSGHSTVNCWALKHKTQDIIDAEDIIVLRKRGESGLNVSKNPLPEYKNTVGAITTDEEFEEFAKNIVEENEVIGIVQKPFVLE